MKRVFTVAALIAVAAATYVATATGAGQAGPTAKQFKALSKEVASLQKQVKGLQIVAGVDTAILQDCMSAAVPINQFGDPNGTYGYAYTPSGGAPELTTALDVTSKDDAKALWITGGQAVCGNDINGSALRKAVRLAHVRPSSAPRVVFQGRH